MFTVKVNAAGTVELDQIRTLKHPDVNNSNEAVTLSNANLIKLTASVTITDKDGDTQTGSQSIDIGKALSFKDDAPTAVDDLSSVQTPSIPEVWSIVIDFVNTNASYNNSFGYYIKDANGFPTIGKIIWEGVQDGTPNNTFTLNQTILPGVNPVDIGYFIIPDGHTKNNANISDGTSVTFSLDGNGDWQARTAVGNIALTGEDANIFFDNGNLNIDNYIHLVNMGNGQYNWEDIFNGGDADFNDVEVTIQNNFPSGTNPTNSLIFGNVLDNDMLSADAPNLVTAIKFGAQEFAVPVGGLQLTGADITGEPLNFILIINQNGSYSFNPALNTSGQKIDLNFQYKVVDGDGDNSWAKLEFDVLPQNNLPAILVSATAAADALVVDETNLLNNATANFADNFTITSSFGGDGPGVLSPPTYTLSVVGGPSGLVDVATGQNVILSMNSGMVEGRTQTSNVLVFTVSVSAVGTVLLDQIRALKHTNTSNPDESTTLSLANLIKLTASDTITDSNSDSKTSSASIDIGTAISFKDDAPSMTSKTDPDSDNIVEISVNNPNASGTIFNAPLANWSYGADAAATSNPVSLTSSGSGNVVLSGTAAQPILTFKDASNVTVATLTMNVNGNDVLDVVHRTPATITDTLLTSEVTASGAGLTKYIISSISDLRVKITASDGDGSASEGNGDDDVNPGAQGWGVDNTLITRNESMKFEFIDNSDFPTVNQKPVQNFSFIADGFTGSENAFDIQVIVTYATGHSPATETFSLNVSSGQVVSITGLSGFDSGTLIRAVEVKHVETDTTNGFRLNDVKVTSSSAPVDLDYNFTLKIVDNDGDFVNQAFTLHLDGESPLSSPGYAIDGPIAGATIYQDENNNATHDLNESFTISNPVGAYNLSIIDTNLDGIIDGHDGRLVSFGGQDIETHLQYHIPLFAPLGSEIISPLTSVLVMQTDNFDLHTVNQQLVEGLGLLVGTDLTKLNPIEAAYTGGDLSSLAKAAAIMTLSVQLSEAFGHKLGVVQADVANEIYDAIGNQILTLPKGTIADFTDSHFLHAIVEDASHQLGLKASDFDPIMNLLTESQMALHNSVDPILPKGENVAAISEVQHYTQGEYADAIGKYYSGALSEDQLTDLTESVHQYNQAEGKGNINETGLELADVVSGESSSHDAALSVLNEPSPASSSNTSNAPVPSSTVTPSEPEPISGPTSIESTHIDPPPTPHDIS